MATVQPPSSKGMVEELLPGAEEGEEEGKGSLWVEIRIPAGSDLERRNMEPIYRWIRNEAYGAEDVFEFVVAGVRSPEGEGLKVRYFMRAPDRDRKRALRNRLDGRGFSVYEVEEPPDFSRYEWEAKLEMDDDFAMPIIPVESIERGNFPRIPEQLASAVKDGGAFRVVMRRDDDARSDIQRFIDREEAKGGDPWSIVMGILDNITAGRTHDGVPEARREKTPSKRETEYSRLAKKRRNQVHVCCEIRAYGNEDQIRGISSSFGFEFNDIVESSRRRPRPESNRREVEEKVRNKLKTALGAVEAVSEMKEDFGADPEGLKVPVTEEGRKTLNSGLSGASEGLSAAAGALSDASKALESYQEEKIVPDRSSGAKGGLLRAALFLPFLLPVALAYAGLWNPLSILGFSSSSGLIRSLWPLLVPVGITVGCWLWLFGGRGVPVVLTVKELSVIGSLPSKPETLPVEYGGPTPPSSGGEEFAGEEENEKGGESEDDGEQK